MVAEGYHAGSFWAQRAVDTAVSPPDNDFGGSKTLCASMPRVTSVTRTSGGGQQKIPPKRDSLFTLGEILHTPRQP